MRSSPIRTFSPSDLCLEAGWMVHQQASPAQRLLELVTASQKSVSLTLPLILLPPVQNPWNIHTHTHTHTHTCTHPPDLNFYLSISIPVTPTSALEYVYHFHFLYKQKDSVWRRILEPKSYRGLWVFLIHTEKWYFFHMHLQIFQK